MAQCVVLYDNIVFVFWQINTLSLSLSLRACVINCHRDTYCQYLYY